MYSGSVNCNLTNDLYFSCVFCSYVSPRLFRLGDWDALIHSFDAQLYHIKVVKWHLMPVTTEDVHESVLVNVSGVSVTSRGAACDHTELGLSHGWVTCHGKALTSLSTFAHLLVVGVKGMVRVLDDE